MKLRLSKAILPLGRLSWNNRAPKGRPPQIRTRPFRASGSSRLRFCGPLLSATVALTRLLTTLSSSRVSQWQFRKPTPLLTTHRLPRVGFPAF